MRIKLSTWSCLEIRMQDKVTVFKLIIVPLKGWKSFIAKIVTTYLS